MAAHLIIVACLVAEPHTCSEIPVPDITLDDVISCSHQARELSQKWQADHKDQYLVIATKCLKADEGATGKAPSGDAGKTGESGAAPNGGDATKPDEAGKSDTPQQ
jgi:hypothetical protein